MLVVSKFHDFYDKMMSQGVDKTLVYKRETADTNEFVELPNFNMDFSEDHKFNNRPTLRLTGQCHVILFCGQVHYYWRGEVKVNKEEGFVTEQVFYSNSKKKLLEAMRMVYGLKESKARSFNWRRYMYDKKDDRVTFKEAVKNFDWHAVHTRIKCPVMTLRVATRDEEKKLRNSSYRTSWYCVVQNPVLTAVGFERYMGPFTAWQEISMYMGGVIGKPDRPMVQLNDVELRDKAGFDKWSFKKMPTK